MKWSYQGSIYGLVDFKMKCSGEFFWRSPAIGNPNGVWDREMSCKENGFRLVAGREAGWPGIVNVRAICEGRFGDFKFLAARLSLGSSKANFFRLFKVESSS